MNNIKQSMISWFAFSITALSTFLAYWAFMNMTEVTSSDTLTATWWNNMISNINDLNNRVNNQSNIPTWAVMAFNWTTCPDWWNVADWSWDEKNTSWINTNLDLRWEFIRGLDSGRWIDIWRNLRSYQYSTSLRVTAMHWHWDEQNVAWAHIWLPFAYEDTISIITPSSAKIPYTPYNALPSQAYDNYIAWTSVASAWYSNLNNWITFRPRNVALLYCVKN